MARFITYHSLITTLILLLSSFNTQAIDLGNESMADKADRFDFEEFHKEKGIVIWEGKKQETTLYEEKPATAKASAASTPVTASQTSATRDQRQFEKGQELKVREAYKLGNDPALRNIQSLYEATEALHRQLNGLCPNGRVRDKEWHKPEQNYFYLHYSAV